MRDVLLGCVLTNESPLVTPEAVREQMLWNSRFGSFASILPCPICRPLSTTADITTSDRGPPACRPPALDLQRTDTAAARSRALTSVDLATRDAPAATEDAPHRLQRLCREALCRGAWSEFCLIAI
jgi:hypothetical protein